MAILARYYQLTILSEGGLRQVNSHIFRLSIIV
jgi:hypothetical protein